MALNAYPPRPAARPLAPAYSPKRGKNGLVALAIVTGFLCVGLAGALAVPGVWVSPAQADSTHASTAVTHVAAPPTPALRHHHSIRFSEPDGNDG